MTECLDSEENIREYFKQVMEDGDAEEIVIALGHIAKAKGMTQFASDTGLAGKVCINRLPTAPAYSLTPSCT